MRAESLSVFFKLRMEKRVKSIFASLCEQRAVTTCHWHCFEFSWLAAPSSNLDWNKFLSIYWEPESPVLQRLDLYIGVLPCILHLWLKAQSNFFSAFRSFIEPESNIFNWIKLKNPQHLPVFKLPESVPTDEIRFPFTLHKRLSCVLNVNSGYFQCHFSKISREKKNIKFW